MISLERIHDARDALRLFVCCLKMDRFLLLLLLFLFLLLHIYHIACWQYILIVTIVVIQKIDKELENSHSFTILYRSFYSSIAEAILAMDNLFCVRACVRVCELEFIIFFVVAYKFNSL